MSDLKITASPIRSESDRKVVLHYDLKVENKKVGTVCVTGFPTGYSFLPIEGVRIRSTERRTMKEIREYVSDRLPQELVEELTRVDKPSIQSAKKLCGLSGNDVRCYIREIRETQPKLHKAWFGTYILNRAMNSRASWSYGAPARKWLVRNAKLMKKLKERLREVDWDYMNRTSSAIFAVITTDRKREWGFDPVRFALWHNGVSRWRGDGPGSFHIKATQEEFLASLKKLEQQDCVVNLRHPRSGRSCEHQSASEVSHD